MLPIGPGVEMLDEVRAAWRRVHDVSDRVITQPGESSDPQPRSFSERTGSRGADLSDAGNGPGDTEEFAGLLTSG